MKNKGVPHKVTLEEALTIQPVPKRSHELALDQTTAWLHMIGDMALKILNQILRAKKYVLFIFIVELLFIVLSSFYSYLHS